MPGENMKTNELEMKAQETKKSLHEEVERVQVMLKDARCTAIGRQDGERGHSGPSCGRQTMKLCVALCLPRRMPALYKLD